MIHDFATVQSSAQTNSSTKTEDRVLFAMEPVRRYLWRHRWSLVAVLSIVALGYVTSDFSWTAGDEAKVASNSSMDLSQEQPSQPLPTPGKSTVETNKASATAQSYGNEAHEVEPDFGFYESLQASPWHIPVQRGIYITEEDRKRSNYRYSLQAASLRSEREAKRVVAQLKLLNLPASYSVTDSDYGNIWYRVNVGPFSNVSMMNKAEDVLVSKGMMPLKRRIK